MTSTFTIKGVPYPYFITYRGPSGTRTEGFWSQKAFRKELRKRGNTVKAQGGAL